MDASSISTERLAEVQGQAAIVTFRKALDIERATALQLLEALPPVPRANPTDTLGRTIDDFA
ncbi:MAG: YjfB family protein [Rhodocyclaceae bacterium]|nr:YjfB family protein [Rhodocyclaceae bacterium]